MKAALGSLAVLFSAAQIIPVSCKNPPERSDPQAPAAIIRLLRRACYDYHSNETRWPWYSAIAPVSWIVSRHVTEARQRLNFSEWADYASDPDTASHKFAEIANEVESGRMAPWYYRMMHREARLDVVERQSLIRWARRTSATTRSSD
jgi:hypothetical protein